MIYGDIQVYRQEWNVMISEVKISVCRSSYLEENDEVQPHIKRPKAFSKYIAKYFWKSHSKILNLPDGLNPDLKNQNVF